MLRELKQELLSYMQEEKASPFRPQNSIIKSDIYIDKARFEHEMLSLKELNYGSIEDLRASKKFILDETGKFKVYLNSCPHRGARLKQTQEGFTCSYHGWQFDQEGKLAKSTGHSCPYPAKSLQLQEIQIERVAGMFMSGEASLYANEIQELFPEYNFLEKRTHSVACNWKFLVESLLETYHFPFVHVPYLEGFDNAFYSMSSANGRNARIVVPLSNFEEAQDQPSLEGINIMYFFFPFSFVLFMTSGFVWFRIVPESVNKSRLESYLYSYGAEEKAARQSLEMLGKILEQDFSILEGQQENALNQQRFHLTGYESLIKLFHRNINEALQQKLSL